MELLLYMGQWNSFHFEFAQYISAVIGRGLHRWTLPLDQTILVVVALIKPCKLNKRTTLFQNRCIWAWLPCPQNMLTLLQSLMSLNEAPKCVRHNNIHEDKNNKVNKVTVSMLYSMLFQKYRRYLKHGNKVINKVIIKLSITDSILLDCQLHHSTLFTGLFGFVLAA